MKAKFAYPSGKPFLPYCVSYHVVPMLEQLTKIESYNKREYLL
jgi:hypothetical protein